MLEFNAEKHEYLLEGKKIPSVTEILQALHNFQFVSKDKLETAKNNGSNIHKALEYYDKNLLSEKSINDYQNIIKIWEDFIKHYDAKIKHIELSLYSPRGFAGTIDRIIEVKNKNILVDIKTGKPNKIMPLQTMAYKLLCQDNNIKIYKRWCVFFQEDKYIVSEHKNDFQDEQIFTSCLNIYNFLRR